MCFGAEHREHAHNARFCKTIPAELYLLHHVKTKQSFPLSMFIPKIYVVLLVFFVVVRNER